MRFNWTSLTDTFKINGCLLIGNESKIQIIYHFYYVCIFHTELYVVSTKTKYVERKSIERFKFKFIMMPL